MFDICAPLATHTQQDLKLERDALGEEGQLRAWKLEADLDKAEKKGRERAKRARFVQTQMDEVWDVVRAFEEAARVEAARQRLPVEDSVRNTFFLQIERRCLAH